MRIHTNPDHAMISSYNINSRMERTNSGRIHSEESRKNLLKPDHPMILNFNIVEPKIHTNPDHSMIPNTNIDISTPKRTPEDRAQSPNYYKIRDQSCKD